MSRKDFNKLAAGIRELLEVSNNREAVQRFAELAAGVCQEGNIHFDRQKFLTACGLGD